MRDESQYQGERFRQPRLVGRRALLKLLGGGALVAGASGAGQAETSSSYWTIVALPDTQYYTTDSDLIEYAHDQTDWIVTNREAENIAFVAHEGDLVNDGSDTTQWERIDGVMDTLDAEGSLTGDTLIPYAAPPGDHDWAIEEDRSSSTENYRKYFGQSRYDDQRWFGGSAPNELSHYQLFSAGGYDFLHIALEWEAPGDASDPTTPLGWAQSIMDQYPDRPTILTTHSYIWDGDPPGRTTFVEEDNGNGSSGEKIWHELIKPNPQVFMVLNGNFHKSDGEYHQVSTNAVGLPVYEMLACYQHYDNGGNGWLRLIQFMPGGGNDDRTPDRIQVKTYSPSLDEYQTDSDSEFHFDLDFASRFTPPTIETVTFQQGVDAYDGTVDTYLDEENPTADNSTATSLIVDGDHPTGTDQERHALLRFEDIVGAGGEQIPPNASILSATLTVETTNEGEGASLHRMLTSWSDTDNWETFDGDGIQADDTEAASSADATTGFVDEGPTFIDVTASVKAWINGQTNHGWAFLPSGGDGWVFDSAEGATPPELQVTYTEKVSIADPSRRQKGKANAPDNVPKSDKSD